MFEEILNHLLTQGEYFLRIIIAGICGIVIGYERKNRLKEAGIRTHLIVAMGSALMMVVSKYGFMDVLDFAKADASRIASQIVTGVGFLGAGTIFVRKQVISGLTTAAGIWSTAGIGMAVGAGMYSVGIATAIAIVVVQMIFHGNVKFLKTPSVDQITVRVENTQDGIAYVTETLKNLDIAIVNMSFDKVSAEYANLDILVKFPSGFQKTDIAKEFIESDKVKTVDF